MTPAEFIAALADAARASARRTRVPASFVVAQAALESGWGKSQSVARGCNLFGVKADKAWTGPTFGMDTSEYVNGAKCTVSATWRKYATWQECLDDHAQFFIRNRRYKPAFETQNGEDFARAVAKAGYATDPAYADKVIAVMRSHSLAALDKPT